jgi:hypothetical protein
METALVEEMPLRFLLQHLSRTLWRSLWRELLECS